MTEAERRVLKHMSRQGTWFTMLELALTKLLEDGDHTYVHKLTDEGFIISVNSFSHGMSYALSQKGKDAAI